MRSNQATFQSIHNFHEFHDGPSQLDWIWNQEGTHLFARPSGCFQKCLTEVGRPLLMLVITSHGLELELNKNVKQVEHQHSSLDR